MNSPADHWLLSTKVCCNVDFPVFTMMFTKAVFGQPVYGKKKSDLLQDFPHISPLKGQKYSFQTVAENHYVYWVCWLMFEFLQCIVRDLWITVVVQGSAVVYDREGQSRKDNTW